MPTKCGDVILHRDRDRSPEFEIWEALEDGDQTAPLPRSVVRVSTGMSEAISLALQMASASLGSVFYLEQDTNTWTMLLDSRRVNVRASSSFVYRYS